MLSLGEEQAQWPSPFSKRYLPSGGLRQDSLNLRHPTPSPFNHTSFLPPKTEKPKFLRPNLISLGWNYFFFFHFFPSSKPFLPYCKGESTVLSAILIPLPPPCPVSVTICVPALDYNSFLEAPHISTWLPSPKTRRRRSTWRTYPFPFRLVLASHGWAHASQGH